jgi:hypothetical protein
MSVVPSGANMTWRQHRVIQRLRLKSDFSYVGCTGAERPQIVKPQPLAYTPAIVRRSKISWVSLSVQQPEA